MKVWLSTSRVSRIAARARVTCAAVSASQAAYSSCVSAGAVKRAQAADSARARCSSASEYTGAALCISVGALQ